VFEDTATGGWIYVSNSESSSNGGVGAITFDSEGNVIGYQRILSGTRRNCGGGKSFFNTWLTCEEADGGQVYEV
jgi:secreted PhoX family phosphatase